MHLYAALEGAGGEAALAIARVGPDAALWFAERGFGTFSVWSTDATGRCRCPGRGACTAGKHPISSLLAGALALVRFGL